jgi:hypothetical protein
VGSYEDLVRATADAVLKPGASVSIHELAALVAARSLAISRDDRLRPLDTLILEAVLRGDPRFIEVAPGMWVRRDDGPEAGVRSPRRRPPFAGSAAAEAVPPERQADLDAVGGAGGRAATAAS